MPTYAADSIDHVYGMPRAVAAIIAEVAQEHGCRLAHVHLNQVYDPSDRPMPFTMIEGARERIYLGGSPSYLLRRAHGFDVFPIQEGADPGEVPPYDTWVVTSIPLPGSARVSITACRYRDVTRAGGSGVRKVFIIHDDIDRHGAGCSCGLCNTQGTSYGVALYDVSALTLRAGEELPEAAIEQLSGEDAMERLYGPDEATALENARAHVRAQGWELYE